MNGAGLRPSDWHDGQATPDEASSAAGPYRRRTASIVMPPSVSGYRIIEHVADGGMGTVYRAVDLHLERTVAIKVIGQRLLDQPDRVELFSTEARLLATVEHPNIVSVYQYGHLDDGSTPYLILQWVEGESLQERLKRRGGLPLMEAVDLILQAASGLHAAHARGIVHGDVKPANLLIGFEDVVKVADFGLATAPGSPYPAVLAGSSQSDEVVGTPAYMAPEQVFGHPLDRRTDIYALGLTLYEALTGRRPFDETATTRMLLAQAQRPLPDLREDTGLRDPIPEQLLRLLDRMTAKEAEDRPATMAAVIDELNALRQANGGDVRISNSSRVFDAVRPPDARPGSELESSSSWRMGGAEESSMSVVMSERAREMSDAATSQLRSAIRRVLRIEGAFACAIANHETGECYAIRTLDEEFNIRNAAIGNAEVVAAKRKVTEQLGFGDQAIDDILVTLDEQYHIMRPLRSVPSRFVYVALYKGRANLAQARKELAEIAAVLPTGPA